MSRLYYDGREISHPDHGHFWRLWDQDEAIFDGPRWIVQFWNVDQYFLYNPEKNIFIHKFNNRKEALNYGWLMIEHCNPIFNRRIFITGKNRWATIIEEE